MKKTVKRRGSLKYIKNHNTILVYENPRHLAQGGILNGNDYEKVIDYSRDGAGNNMCTGPGENNGDNK